MSTESAEPRDATPEASFEREMEQRLTDLEENRRELLADIKRIGTRFPDLAERLRQQLRQLS